MHEKTKINYNEWKLNSMFSLFKSQCIPRLNTKDFFNPKNRKEKIICSWRKFSRCRWSNSAAVWGKCEKQMLKMIYNCAKNEEKEFFIFTRERISKNSTILLHLHKSIVKFLARCNEVNSVFLIKNMIFHS